MDLPVFLVLLGFLSFAYSSFCLVFLASQKTKKHEQPENQETQANNEKQANRENTKNGLVSTPARGFKDKNKDTNKGKNKPAAGAGKVFLWCVKCPRVPRISVGGPHVRCLGLQLTPPIISKFSRFAW